jgi:catechol 2,3-dioxygenase-like lactoylglutathione lyase family enzyme
MPGITGLGHVGLYCTDLDAQVSFYTGLLGLQITDVDPEHGLVFLSAQPEVEHHELLLTSGRNVGRDAHVVQQISFRCDSLEAVIDFYRRLEQHGAKLDMVVSHGNAIGVYFYDPEGNRCEVYWPTGLSARQPYLLPVDLSADPDTILAAVERAVAQYGATGIIDESVFANLP